MKSDMQRKDARAARNTLAAGDGLLGELQFMLAAMSAQFLILWLGIAWIF